MKDHPRLRLLCYLLMLTTFSVSATRAQIVNWNTGEVIPGTEAINLTVGANLTDRNSPDQNLQYADFQDSYLPDTLFRFSDLRNARFDNANVSSSQFIGANLEGTTWHGATIQGANFRRAVGAGLTEAQFSSTQSFQDGRLRGVNLSENDLSGWDFAAADVDQGIFFEATLIGTDFSAASLGDAQFFRATLDDANFANANLRNADLRANSFTGTTFDDADIGGADLEAITPNGFTADQLYATASYKSGNLTDIEFDKNVLDAWNFATRDLSGASFAEASLANTLFEGAIIQDANFDDTTKNGFAEQQLRSTASYQNRQLSRISLEENEMAGWVFTDQELDRASFRQANLQDASFENANLQSASFIDANLTRANLVNANLQAARFSDTRSAADVTEADFTGSTLSSAVLNRVVGFTNEQLYSSASYQSNVLSNIELAEVDMGGWDFSEQALDSAEFDQANAVNARFVAANLSGASFAGADLTNADFSGATLEDVEFSGFNGSAILSGAEFTDATIKGARFRGTYALGMTHQQLYSTASYKAQNLQGVDLSRNDLTGLNLDSQDLTGAEFNESNVTDAVFGDAIIADATFDRIAGLSPEQFYSTASYKNRQLNAIRMTDNDLVGWDLQGQNLESASFFRANMQDANLSDADLSRSRLQNAVLANANLAGADLTRANLIGADLAGADFEDALVPFATLDRATSNGFQAEQLYSTASYKAKNLPSISLRSNDLSGWNFREQRLGGADFQGAQLSDTDFEDATIQDASFSRTTATGFRKEQLYSTASYKDRNLQGIKLFANDLSGWDFANQDLSRADLRADLTGANFDGANLTDSDLNAAVLADAIFDDAVIAGAQLERTTAAGFDQSQLYATRSYRTRNLRGVRLSENDLAGWNFGNQDLTDAVIVQSDLTSADLSHANLNGVDLRGSTLTDADLSFADLRRAQTITGDDLVAGSLRNTILPSGAIDDLQINSGENLVVRNGTLPVSVRNGFEVEEGGTLEFRIPESPWTSPLQVFPGVTAELEGSLTLVPELGTDLSSLVGRQIRLFNWGTSLQDDGEANRFTVQSGLQWNLDELYSRGIAELVSAEPMLAGDFDLDGELGGRDIDLISMLASGDLLDVSPQLDFDLNTDGIVDDLDRVQLVEQLMGTRVGDIDLDGEVQFSDFLVLARNFGDPGGWSRGDLDGSGFVEFPDFLLLTRNYGGRPNASRVANVPEPNALGLWMAVLASMQFRRTRCSRCSRG